MNIDWRWPLFVAAFLGLLVSVRMAAAPLALVNVSNAGTPQGQPPLEHPSGRIAAESAAVIVARNPFRIGHRAVLPPYDPLRLADQQAPPPPRPALTVVGILEGAEPSAVIEGLPGDEGFRVVRVGDVIGAVRIHRIAGGRVQIVGMDTTWVLEVREPWKQ